MKVSVPCAAALALFPLVSAFPAPTAAPGELDIIKYGLDALEARGLLPRQGGISISLSQPVEPTTTKPETSSSSSSQPPSSSSSSSSSSSTSSVSSPPPSDPANSSTPTPPAETSKPLITHSSASQIKIESTQEDGQVVTYTSSIIITAVETPSTSPSATSPADSDDSEDSGISTSTVIGLSVAGGLTALCAIAFIVWKFTNKRFSQFDNDDGAINWPELQKDPEVIAPRPAPSVGAISTTNSTVELVKDPYAVPPLPQNNGGLGPYRDDAASGYYDPYRGPIPQTFATPPASTDGHQPGWTGGEAIPMSTYASGRASPGPTLAYGDPYANAMRSTSPGPNLAYAVDPTQRTGTPLQRMATPVQRMATPGAATFQEIARAGTPGGGPVPYRTGTPGYGYGGR